MSESNILAYVNSSFNFFMFASNYSLLLIVFRLYFTWVALDDVDLHFSLMVVRKANAVEEEVTCSV